MEAFAKCGTVGILTLLFCGCLGIFFSEFSDSMCLCSSSLLAGVNLLQFFLGYQTVMLKSDSDC